MADTQNTGGASTDALPYRFCAFDGAVLVPAIKDGMKGWQCPEEGCPYFEPDPNAPVGDSE